MSDDDKMTGIYLRAHALGKAQITIDTLGKSVEEMTDLEVALIAFGTIAMRVHAATKWPADTHRCGWCARAAGDTQEAWDAAERYSHEEIFAHTTSCQHNPVVAELARVRSARDGDQYDQMVDILEAESARDRSRYEYSVDGTGDHFEQLPYPKMVAQIIEERDTLDDGAGYLAMVKKVIAEKNAALGALDQIASYAADDGEPVDLRIPMQAIRQIIDQYDIDNSPSLDLVHPAPEFVLGTGADGDVVFDGTSTVLGITPIATSYSFSGDVKQYILARDIHCESLRVPAGVLMVPDGYQTLVRGTLTVDGFIAQPKVLNRE